MKSLYIRFLAGRLFLFGIEAIAAVTGPSKTTQLQFRSFDTSAGNNCSIRVNEYDHPNTDLDEKFIITCGRQVLLVHDFYDAGIGNIDLSNDGTDRIQVIWERGTGAGITIFQVLGDKAKVVFDHFSKCGGESFDDQDIVFANVGRRFFNALILPAATNVYRWKDGKYVFIAAYHWDKTANDRDRYCILNDGKNCPATIQSKPALDEY